MIYQLKQSYLCLKMQIFKLKKHKVIKNKMELNSVIFPAPLEDKNEYISRYKNDLIFIPKHTKNELGNIKKIYKEGENVNNSVPGSHIPCLFMYSKKKPDTNKFLIYFHGNAEDIFNSINSLDLLKNIIPYNVIAVEYPGYSLYFSEKSAATIEDDALIVFDFLVRELQVNPKDITVLGRSIGSGPAVYISAHREPAALVLISPFKSLRDTAESIIGIFKVILADRFKNIELISKVTCPTLFIHGQKDELINFKHSIELSKKISGPYDLILPEEMNHNDYNIYEDFVDPVCEFFKRHNLLNENKGNNKAIIVPKEYHDFPNYLKDMKELQQKDSVTEIIRNLTNM